MRLLSVAIIASSTICAHAAHEIKDRNVDTGMLRYQEHCAACHGENLEGQPNWRIPNENGVLPAPPHNETGHTWHHDNQLLFNYTKLGGEALMAARGMAFNSGMPAFENTLSDDDIWNILAYIRSTWSDEVKEIQAKRNPLH